MDGAVHRLRPKLLTEGVIIIGLAPMLWATGVGAEIMRPMAAPVLGGLLIADEVIDLLLPGALLPRPRPPLAEAACREIGQAVASGFSAVPGYTTIRDTPRSM